MVAFKERTSIFSIIFNSKKMTRQERIEREGYKIIHAMSGQSVFAEKNGRRIKEANITQLHRKIFGY